MDDGVYDSVCGFYAAGCFDCSAVLLWEEFEEVDEEFGDSSDGTYDLGWGLMALGLEGGFYDTE